MPYTCKLLPDERLVVIHLSGSIGGRDILQAIISVADDEAWSRSHRAVWDLREVDQIRLAPTEIQSYAEAIEARGEDIAPSRSAYITTRYWHRNAIRIFARHIQRVAPDHEARTFSNVESAADWLRISASRLNGYL